MAPQSTFNTVHLNAFLERLRAGDRAAADNLLRRIGDRLERLARRMLKGFPNVKRWADTGDVLQSALVQLLRSLQALRPETTRDFDNLAAVYIRRELLDPARHYRGRLERAAPTAADGDTDDNLINQVPDRADAAGDLDLWRAFHERVELLPTAKREVVGQTFYHDWNQAEIAALLQVDERTVRRRWRSACLRLSVALGGRLPQA
jgi:RNA polymerase sigma factor (sigma-70 family)